MHSSDPGHGTDSEPIDESLPGWALWPSPSSLGQWIAHRKPGGGLFVLAAPGVALDERWDSDELLWWRQAIWPDIENVEFTPPSQRRCLAGLAEAIELVPTDALADHDIHRWMIAATEAHADALERLALLQERQPGPGVAEAVSELRRVVRRHREQAAQCSQQPSPLVAVDRSAHDLAQVAVDDPNGLLARLERQLEQHERLTQFVACLHELEEKFGAAAVRDALAGLLFAKHRSHSWQLTRYFREGRLRVRRAARRTLRRVHALETKRSRGRDGSSLDWSARLPSSESRAPDRTFL